MPNAAVFLPAIKSPLTVDQSVMPSFLLVGDVDLAFDFVSSTHYLCGFGFDRLLFLVRVHRSFQSDNSILGNHLDVVCVRGKGLVFHQGPTHMLGESPIRAIFFLLLGRGFVLVAVTLVHFCVVGWRLSASRRLLLLRDRKSTRL